MAEAKMIIDYEFAQVEEFKFWLIDNRREKEHKGLNLMDLYKIFCLERQVEAGF